MGKKNGDIWWEEEIKNALLHMNTGVTILLWRSFTAKITALLYLVRLLLTNT